ncbi:hypothetical protein [Nitrincola tapanii]|uniref:Uncharacterized protein n=1 Tax=Nitrincola tapanii TaxID=1708751 RepID=A0A5A9W0L2_9GAMM|nr:hypothetical protein [Nitrincola tapanii]KAA0874102.1 hypothetical protein E1H14_10005 [Nitrincola tapanii]
MQTRREPQINLDKLGKEASSIPLLSSEQQISEPRQSGSILLTLILLTLVVVSAGLAWLLLDLKQAFEQQRQQMMTSEARLVSAEVLLSLHTNGSEAGEGKTLVQRLEALELRAQEQQAFVAAELNRLWADLAQIKTAQIEPVQLALDTLKGLPQEMSSLAATLLQQEQRMVTLTLLEERLTALQQSLQPAEDLGPLLAETQAEQQSMKKELTDLVTQVQQAQTQLQSRVQTQTREQQSITAQLSQNALLISSETEARQALERELRAALQGLSNQTAAVGSQQTAQQSLEARIRSNEQAIQAIDSFRQQTNRELLSLREQLNSLRLQTPR